MSTERKAVGHAQLRDAIFEYRTLCEEEPDAGWKLSAGIDRRYRNYRRSEFVRNESTSWPLLWGVLGIAALLTVVLPWLDGTELVTVMCLGALSLNAAGALIVCRKKRRTRISAGLAAPRGMPITVPPESLDERAERLSLPLEDPPDTTNAPSAPAAAGVEPTNEELLDREWPLLPIESTPDSAEPGVERAESEPETESFWERQTGYRKFQQIRENGHKSLLEAVQENHRLNATSDHAWTLSRGGGEGLWYNYMPQEMGYGPDLRGCLWFVGILTTLLALGSILAIPVVLFQGPLINLLFCLGGVLPSLLWAVLFRPEWRAMRARNRRHVPAPTGRPYRLQYQPPPPHRPR